MTTCATPFDLLSAYVDAELTLESELELRRHLDSCARCRELVEMLVGLKEAVTSTAELRPVPHSLRERVATLTRPASRERRWAVAIAVAASVCMVALGVYAWRTSPPRAALEDGVVEALVADHVHFRQVPDAPEVRSDDPAKVGAWFEGKVRFPVALPRLRSASLVGGRLCSLWGQKVAVGFYETEGERVSLFVADAARFPSPVPDGARCEEGLGGYRVCVVPAGDAVLLMVADSARASLLFPEVRASIRTHAASRFD